MLIAGKPFKGLSPELTSQIKFVSPNLDEVLAIARTLCPGSDLNGANGKSSTEEILKCMTVIGPGLLQSIDNILVTLSDRGVVLLTNHDPRESYFFEMNGSFAYSVDEKHKRPMGLFYSMEDNGGQLHPEDIVNVSGAGDSFTSGFVTGILQGFTGNQAIWKGMAAARCALRSQSAVPKSYKLMVEDMPAHGATARNIF